jgi:hypothetical protein
VTHFVRGSEHTRELAKRAAAVRWSREKGEALDWSLLELADRAGLVGESWRAGRVLLKVSAGIPLEPDELPVFQRCTGREQAPTTAPRELWEASGRRSAKSFRAALKAVHAAGCRRYTVAPGERPTVLLLAADREQATIDFRYVRGIIDSIPDLKALVTRRRKDQLELSTGVDIHVATSDYKLVRGRTCCAAICDELAFWKSETSASPDVETLAALRPSLATIPTAQLLCVSTVYARSGALYAAFEAYWGKDDPHVVFWRAPTREMNPNIPPELIERELAEDPERARAEWLAEWRADVSSVFAVDAVRACIVPGRRELPPVADATYTAFCDPSGGSQDSMTLAVGHVEAGVGVLDLVRERRPPFDPGAVVREFAGTLKGYRVGRLVGDRYGGVWVAQAFREAGIDYVASEAAKSELYVRLVPLVNTGQVALLDLPALVAQACGLERRVARGTGAESIDHGPHAHDDLVNSVAGCLVLAAGGQPGDGWIDYLKAEVLRTGAPLPPSATAEDRARAGQRTVRLDRTPT